MKHYWRTRKPSLAEQRKYGIKSIATQLGPKTGSRSKFGGWFELYPCVDLYKQNMILFNSSFIGPVLASHKLLRPRARLHIWSINQLMPGICWPLGNTKEIFEKYLWRKKWLSAIRVMEETKKYSRNIWEISKKYFFFLKCLIQLGTRTQYSGRHSKKFGDVFKIALNRTRPGLHESTAIRF